ncbi:Na+/H+ antiporter subunit E [Staphylococcus pseudintermedius]|uniref:Na+/H+ antiporter subunit E n=2 Tax=Staphylococcus pseudintermedius TaxID=283734 RepID=A0A2A4EFF8_STAPS|nr:Na+/H+ antiporter subunit E [Staphylococcus pseudintermedius]ADV05159.1 Na(+) H(+) antiporter subunit E [Staphylococcus pseudintermedius HKU10-03]ADX77142.1 monovalent cation/H+ antiporter subunit E [Staphylococcus pseudintermedius ED99]ANQ82356.1 cation:proton antiporter [Staphylococcus pseudintermedius]ANQ88830.1 cation:proton antiporter [Staphylococcus pseudintermedius]ASQ51140.1 monovalent cation/H+ antiporter subunit E [Staphylococcus pseudintermedius]
MAIQIVINLFLAIFWLFVSDSYTMNAFVLGYLFALLLVFLMRKLLPGRFYVITLYKVIKLVFVFLLELIKANIDVLRIILQPRIKNESAFFVYETDLEHPWQVALLSNLITLTPGTVVIGVNDDMKRLYIHCLNFSTKEEEVAGIKGSLEKAVREVGES